MVLHRDEVGNTRKSDANSIITLKKGDKGYEKALKKFNYQSKLAQDGKSIYKPSLLNEHEAFTFEALNGKKSGVKFSRTNPNQIIHYDPPNKNSPRARQYKQYQQKYLNLKLSS